MSLTLLNQVVRAHKQSIIDKAAAVREAEDNEQSHSEDDSQRTSPSPVKRRKAVKDKPQVKRIKSENGEKREMPAGRKSGEEEFYCDTTLSGSEGPRQV